MTRPEKIRELLTAGLAPEAIEIADESAFHAGHAGAASGGGIRALFYDTSGALVINDEVIDYLSLSGSDWSCVYARISVPENAAFMGIAAQVSTNTIRYTQVQLFRANNLT